MWRTYYFAIDNYRKNHPEWIFKKHEDLSVNTTEEFHDIFRRIFLDYSRAVHKMIEAFTNRNPVEALDGVRHEVLKNY